MKRFAIVLALLSTIFFAQAQTQDSIDNITFNIPKNWQADKQPAYTQLTSFSKDRFCQVAIYQKQAANADKTASFEKEWSDLVLASFDAVTSASPQLKKIRSGQSVLYFGAQAVNRSNNQLCYVELNMFDCGNSVQSAMLISASKQHLQFFDSSWQSLIAKVKTTGKQGVIDTEKFPFTGNWGQKSNAYGTVAGNQKSNTGYYNCRYDFKPNGNYSFHGESWDGDNYFLIDESGSYSVIDTQLVIMPSKNNAQYIDKAGKAKPAAKMDMSRRIYTWKLHHFAGLNETGLVLKPVTYYLQDGDYSSNLLFPTSYLLSNNFSPKWKIPVK